MTDSPRLLAGTDEAWAIFRRSRDASDCDALEMHVRIVCDPRVVGVRPELTNTDFFMPDRNDGRFGGALHDGDEAVRCFDFAAVASRNRANGRTRFFGPYCHGPAGDEFIYLGWKPSGRPEAPWVWRIKMSLRSITWEQIEAASSTRQCFEFDATGRTPHQTPIVWRIEPA